MDIGMHEWILSSLGSIRLNGRDEELRSLVIARKYHSAALLCMDLHRETAPLAKYHGADEAEPIVRQRMNLLRLLRNLHQCVNAQH
jgi:hypothetical protein